MLIIDKDPRSNIKDNFTARSAAIYGFSIFGKKHTYLLNNEGNIDYNSLNGFLDKYGNEKFYEIFFSN